MLLSLSVVGLVAFGILGVGRASFPFEDSYHMYAAGRCWLAGDNPYHPEIFEAALLEANAPGDDITLVFGYPPVFAPFCMAVALFEYPQANQVMIVLNLVAVALFAWLTILLVTQARQVRPASYSAVTPWLLAILVIGNPFTATVLWLGQTSVWAAVLMMGGWYCIYHHKQKVMGGVLLGIALFKPHCVLLPVIWLVFDRQWRAIAVAGVVALVLAAYPMIVSGPIDTVTDWLHAMVVYRRSSGNFWGDQRLLGMPSAMAAAGLPGIPLQGLLLGAVFVTWMLWRYRQFFCADDMLGILIALQLGFVFGHWYDLILLAPLAAAVWLHVAHRPRAWPYAGALVVLLCFPHRLVVESGVALLVHWRTGVVVLCLVGLLYLSRRSVVESGPSLSVATS
jgi:hypothetical protein